MQTAPDLSTIAALIGDPTRASILWSLLDGQALPATELSYRAHVTAQTVSAHLTKLVEGGLLEVSRVGRHRYYRLKNARVARVLEDLALLSPPPVIRPRQDSAEHDALCFARTCYDHLAGKLGVALTQALVDKGLITLRDQSYTLTEQGSDWLTTWEIDERQLRKGRRMFARTCLDWTERREHLAGALGAAIMTRLFEIEWVTRIPGKRALHLTEAGRQGFRREFAISVQKL